MTKHGLSVSKSIGASADQLWPLLADTRNWSRWGPFTAAANDGGIGAPQGIALGRRTLHLYLTYLDAPYLLRYQAGTGGYSHTAELILSPTADGRTELTWRAELHRGLSRILGRPTRLAREAGQLLSALAAYAEDPPTTRIEWAAQASASQAARPREFAA